MRDITNVIKNAISKDVAWAVDSFFSVIEKVRNERLTISFWEGEENWAGIIANNETVGYIWRKHPLV
ncbi:hypothetical protein [Polluticoccus soli]|uniref:hypothetical protein n=1 Tax=Polluticoccus soli TaxID=3034150 RepID=UPI0023E3289A|nr:hypothetical protein [Flavipsychrobacter sp. JY13-12]